MASRPGPVSEGCRILMLGSALVSLCSTILISGEPDVVRNPSMCWRHYDFQYILFLWQLSPGAYLEFTLNIIPLLSCVFHRKGRREVTRSGELRIPGETTVETKVLYPQNTSPWRSILHSPEPTLPCTLIMRTSPSLHSLRPFTLITSTCPNTPFSVLWAEAVFGCAFSKKSQS